jgi:23S rRNA (uracil1939-C5)-methyltransferase
LDFIQVNAGMNQNMVNAAMALLKPQKTDRILDLFCGLGNFSLPLALDAAYVIGVEGSTEMVKRAGQNAVLNHIDNIEFYADNLMLAHSESPWRTQTYTKALIDPPRTGALEILPALAQSGIQALVYVSCNPATFARDAGILVNQHGFRLISVQVFNMFPHTAHVESMGYFERTQ